MSKQEKITIISGIALLYTVITAIFALLQKIITSIIAQGTINNRISWFLQRNTLWIVVVTAIITTLSIHIKKQNEKASTILDENPMIGLATGVLVVLKGISDFASTLPVNIISVKSVFEALSYTDVFLDGTKERMILDAVLTNALSIVIILCQISMGIYLVKAYKKKVN